MSENYSYLDGKVNDKALRRAKSKALDAVEGRSINDASLRILVRTACQEYLMELENAGLVERKIK